MKKILYVALILILTGIIGTLIIYQTTDTFHSAEVQPQKKTMLIDGVKDIKIDTSTVDVQVEKTDGRSLSAELQGWGNKHVTQSIKLNVKKEGQILNINVGRKGPFISFTFGKMKLVVKVPDQLYDSVRAQSASGDLSVRSLSAKQLSLAADSGNVVSENNQAADRLSLQTTSGDITLKHTQIKNNAVVSANSGDVVIDGLTAKSSQIETTAGEITVQNATGNLAAQADSGDIQIKNDSLAGNISAETTSGNLNIDFAKKPASFSLDYSGSSGMGTVQIDGLLYEEKTEHTLIGKKGSGAYQIRARTDSGDFSLK
ncbi:DUF4097 family beta strand repeat-containing protein [Sporolactobacillus pectinivorans]|uniref:DUF4097 family beta strand repeat-containing protein n=1 Tax=Sporolactobacillus pectinivorans TaxID=1591408 RepID=UPI000C2681E2|nr:DUF4097 family beta strand repeat-containing protein [Sporolactobacillus pectinivorans]